MLVQNSNTKKINHTIDKHFLNSLYFKHLNIIVRTSHSNNIEVELTALADINVGGINVLLGGPLLKKKRFEVGPDLLSLFEYTAATLNLKWDKTVC